MVQYGRLKYPQGMPLPLVEKAGHFDVQSLQMTVPYSLHTEYSYGARKFTSPALHAYSSIPNDQKRGIPQLWTSMEWSHSFALFIANLTKESLPPSVIEIHPPFVDGAKDISQFLERYEVFEDVMLQLFPSVQIVLENRTGTMNSRGFLISNTQDLLLLSEEIERRSLNLRLAVDIPQLLNAEDADAPDQITHVYGTLRLIQHLIGSIHLWGRKKTRTGRLSSHTGDLNSWFEGNLEAKNSLLSGLRDLTDDQKIRWLVLEVNSGSADLNSIINDLTCSGFYFV